jgi:hypothetical protein
MKTHNGANMEYSAGHPLVEFFSKAGSLFEKRDSFYGNEATALDLFYNAWAVDKIKAFKLLLWCRDIRGGAGNRSGSRKILNWLATQEPEWIRVNLPLIPKYGRWDDLTALVDTPLEGDAMELWASAIGNKDVLACKWAPRENKAGRLIAKLLRKQLNLSPKDYRLHLSGVSKDAPVVETLLCKKEWGGVEYSHVPSVAMARYGKAFKKNDGVRFGTYLEAVKNPASAEKINAGAVFPHDLIRAWKADSTRQNDVVDAQFNALPNFFETSARVMSIVDTSGSMDTVRVSGSITPMDIALGLAYYTSDRLGPENPFYKKFIPFSTDAKFYSWNGQPSFSAALNHFGREHGRGWVGSTNLYSAFNLLLNTANFLNVTSDQMPNVLLIISDMQFNQGVSNEFKTEMQGMLQMWSDAGYELPKVVYWNTAGYAGSPADVFTPNTGLVSGFSPSILNAVFRGTDFSPLGIMESAISKYEITIPVS